MVRGKSAQWRPAWQYVPVDFGTVLGTFENLTQKVIIKSLLGGEQVKLRLENFYQKQEMHLESVTVCASDPKREIMNGPVSVTVNGERRICVSAGKSVETDGAFLRVYPGWDLIVSMYFREPFSVNSAHCSRSQRTFRTAFLNGDRSMDPEVKPGKTALEALPGLRLDTNLCVAQTGLWTVSVRTEDSSAIVGLFGDSITQMSDYSDALQELILEEIPGEMSVLNGGISGNRLLFDAASAPELPGGGKMYGDAGKNRLIRDLYAGICPDFLFILEGINDCTQWIGFGLSEERPDGESLWKGMEGLIRTARQKGSKVILSTVMPFGCSGDPFWKQAEEIRQAFNAKIRDNRKSADEFLDLDEIIRKPEDPSSMRDGLHLGDGVHPDAEGGKLIARALYDVLRNMAFMQ